MDNAYREFTDQSNIAINGETHHSDSPEENRSIYQEVKKVLSDIDPLPLAIEEIESIMDNKLSYRQIYDAVAYGVRIGDLERDTNYHPAKAKLNHHETPAAEKEKQKRGIQKAAVEYLAESGNHMNADELLPFIRSKGFPKLTKESLARALQNAAHRNILARETWSIPYKYYMAEEKRRLFLRDFKVPSLSKLEGMSETEDMIEQKVSDQVGANIQALKAQLDPKECEEFAASMDMDGSLVLTIDGTTKKLNPERSAGLAWLISPLMRGRPATQQ